MIVIFELLITFRGFAFVYNKKKKELREFVHKIPVLTMKAYKYIRRGPIMLFMILATFSDIL